MATRVVLLALCLVFAVRVDQVLADDQWQQQKGDHFIIHYRGEVPEDFVNTVMDEAENDLRQVAENLGVNLYDSWTWENRGNIYIYRDQQDYIQNGGMGWSHGAAMIASKTIKTYPADAGFFDSVLPHELGHILLHELVGPTVMLPLWFDEGVAMYQEKARRVGAHQSVREAIENGQFIPLTRLTDMPLYSNTDEKTVDLFYAESASAVNFMITELGAEHFYKFCRALKKQDRFEDALAKIYGQVKDLDDLNKRWVRYLEEK